MMCAYKIPKVNWHSLDNERLNKKQKFVRPIDSSHCGF